MLVFGSGYSWGVVYGLGRGFKWVKSIKGRIIESVGEWGKWENIFYLEVF